MIPGLFVYLYVLLGLLVLIFDTQKQSKKQYLWVFNAVYIALVLLAAFSYGVGNDTLRYRIGFQYTPTLSNLNWNYILDVRSQPLYVLLNSVCKTVFNDFLSLQLLQVSLFYHSLYLLLRKLKLRKFWVLFLFFGYCYLIEISARRECIGLTFCFYAMLLFLEKKWKLYYLLVVVGFFFHSGVFIYAFFPLFKLLGKLSFGKVILIMMGMSLIPFFFQYLELFSLILNEDDSILRYDLRENAVLKVANIIYVVAELAIIYFYVVGGNHKNLKDYEHGFIYIALFSLMLEVFTSSLPILYRFRPYFAVFLYFALQKCFVRVNKQHVIMLLILFLFSISPIHSFWGMMKDFPAFYNYCSVFSSDEAKSEMDYYGYEFIR